MILREIYIFIQVDRQRNETDTKIDSCKIGRQKRVRQVDTQTDTKLEIKIDRWIDRQIDALIFLRQINIGELD